MALAYLIYSCETLEDLLWNLRVPGNPSCEMLDQSNVLIKLDPFISFPRCLVLIAFHKCLSKLVQYYSLVVWSFLKIVNKHNAFCIQKNEAFIFPANETTLDFFGADERGVYSAWVVSLSLAQSEKPNTHSWLGNIQGKQLYLLPAVSDFPVM